MILQVQKEAVQSVEQDGMVFIDEIDKIVVGSEMRYGKQSCPLQTLLPPVCASLNMPNLPCAGKGPLCCFSWYTPITMTTTDNTCF